MHFSKKISFLSLIFYVFSTFSIQLNAEEIVKNPTIYDIFANDLLKKSPKAEIPSSVDKDKPKILINLSPSELKQVVINLFADLESKENRAYENILSKSFIKDLELFSSNFFQKLNRTTTIPGELELAKMLVTPTTSIEKLKSRQELVKKFLEDKNLSKTINDSLTKFRDNQKILFTFNKNLSQVSENTVKHLFSSPPLGKPQDLSEAIIYFTLLALSKLSNSSPNALRAYNIVKESVFGPFTLLAGLFLGIGTYYKKSDPLLYIPAALSTAFGIFNVLTIKGRLNPVKTLQSQLMAVRNCFDALNEIYKIGAATPQIRKNITELKKVEILINDLETQTEEFQKFVKALNTDTFRGDPSIWSHFGRIIFANKWVTSIQNSMSEVYRALGKVDAFLSIAKLHEEYANERVKFCFVDYSDSPTPDINITNFHHPMINPKTVVTNSVAFGSNNGIKSAIITGPNAGGKSTVLKSVLSCLLLAQTIGIVPAEQAIITPFDKLCAYLNINDDLQAGDSLFMAEARRAIELQKLIESGKRIFVASDEMFTGTDPVEGSAAAYAFAESVANNNSCILMLATHFPFLTKLEEKVAGCKNYKVKVNKIEEGKIDYPFKLENGVANQKVAFDILKIQGFESKIIDRAKEVLNECIKNNVNMFPITPQH